MLISERFFKINTIKHRCDTRHREMWQEQLNRRETEVQEVILNQTHREQTIQGKGRNTRHESIIPNNLTLKYKRNEVRHTKENKKLKRI